MHTLIGLVALVPLALSPGPANILFAASSGAFGTRATLPFLLGTNSVCLLQTLVIGFGFDALAPRVPLLAANAKYLGVAFLLYLAWRFFTSTTTRVTVPEPPGFLDGALIEVLNFKFLMMPTIMFSQFYHTQALGMGLIVLLTLSLATLTLTSNLIWVLAGATLTRFFNMPGVRRYQGVFFGVLLTLTALWLALG